jgi:PhzF family phenazine biosynthesis protein
MDLPFRILNVFGIEGDPFSGNPLCVFPYAAGLDDGQMQSWARQFNLSESAFVTSREADGSAAVRIFTPEHEMPFAGHPVLGTAEVVAKATSGTESVDLTTPAGLIRVTRVPAGWRFTAPAARTREVTSSGAELAAALGVDPDGLVRSDARWVDSGVEQLLVRLDSADAVRACDPDPHLMTRHLTAPGRPPEAYVWAWTGPKSVEARMLYTQGRAVLEDPATGSASANLGGWLAAQGVRDVSIVVSQGSAVGRPSRLVIDVDSGGGVHVGGRVDRVGEGVCSVVPSTVGR